LRAAIQAANNTNGTDDTIEFNIPTTDPGFNSQTGAWTINLSTTLPDLSSNMTISGPGADKLIVKGPTSPQFRIFNVTTSGAVTFSAMTISNGLGASGATQPGGGIHNVNNAQLNINNCTISNNVGSSGGGITSVGPVNISGSTFTNNFAVFSGGAMAINSAVISNSTFTGNSSATGNGGAISSGGTVAVSNCTFGNNSGIAGGAIANAGGTVTLTNSTFSGNSSAHDGGGAIANTLGTGTITVADCTVTGNHLVNSFNGGAGGVFNMSGAMMNIKSSIIALNTATGFNVFADADGAFASGGFNLIGIKDGSTGFTAPTDKTGTAGAPLDPMLSPSGLQNNGGATQTIALLANSPAINAGAPNAPPNDQRGFFRNGPPDIGAFEFGGSFFAVTLGNISTRGLVGIGDEVMIGGFIIGGTGNKMVLLRAKGPSLSDPSIGLANTLPDPTLSLFSGATRIGFNDNWADASNAQSIDPSLRPTNGLESAILVSLSPGAYTAIVSGANGATGIGLVEVFDIDEGAQSKLSNISTRGLVGTGDGVMIGGFIVNGPNSDKVVVRAIGPSLANPPFNLTNVLQNPALALFDVNGNRFAFNDDWRSDQQADIIATGLQPANDAESAIVITLLPGNYTAIVSGVGSTTGLALVEVYGLN
jgi:predicted outer membrane repeat protein